MPVACAAPPPGSGRPSRTGPGPLADLRRASTRRGPGAPASRGPIGEPARGASRRRRRPAGRAKVPRPASPPTGQSRAIAARRIRSSSRTGLGRSRPTPTPRSARPGRASPSRSGSASCASGIDPPDRPRGLGLLRFERALNPPVNSRREALHLRDERAAGHNAERPPASVSERYSAGFGRSVPRPPSPGRGRRSFASGPSSPPPVPPRSASPPRHVATGPPSRGRRGARPG